MKKLLAVLLCCLMLTSCMGEKPEKGAESTTQTTKPLRLIKIDGKLYYDINREDNTDGRCGTLDGYFEKGVGEFEIPQKDNEANFEARGYQSTSSLTVEVPEDGKWSIFRRLDLPEGVENVKYKYAYRLKDKMPNSEVEQEILVLAEEKNPSFKEYMERLFSSQFTPDKSYPGLYFIDYQQDDKWGIRLSAQNVTKTGLTLKLEHFGGEYEGTLEYGNPYTLEKLNEGKWEEAPYKNVAVWNLPAYIVPRNDIAQINVDWSYIYGELTEGTYRIGKEFTDFTQALNKEKQMYYAQFIIE